MGRSVLFLLIILSACHSKKPDANKSKGAPTTADIMIARPQSVSNIVEANGTVVAN